MECLVFYLEAFMFAQLYNPHSTIQLLHNPVIRIRRLHEFPYTRMYVIHIRGISVYRRVYAEL